MATSQVLDSLVKIASAGTSGVCVFAIFYSGNYLIKSGSKISTQQVKAFKFYMLMCIGIAVISAGSGIANAYYKYKEIETLKSKNATLYQKVEASQNQITTLKDEKEGLNKSLSKAREDFTLMKRDLDKTVSEKRALSDKITSLSMEYEDLKRAHINFPMKAEREN
ncbi:hypothetical protein JW926_00765 [Candidatus Sumerlaeota bacterium]|nr:hypothetical protein [Candidatus Sumerlaeota bacterium]